MKPPAVFLAVFGFAILATGCPNPYLVVATGFLLAILLEIVTVLKSSLSPVDDFPQIAYVDGPRPDVAVKIGDRVLVSEAYDSFQETYVTTRWLHIDEIPSVVGALAGDSYGSGRVLKIERNGKVVDRAP